MTSNPTCFYTFGRAPSSTSESTSVVVINTGTGSALPAPTSAMDILEEMTLQMVEQFFTKMKYYTELVLID